MNFRKTLRRLNAENAIRIQAKRDAELGLPPNPDTIIEQIYGQRPTIDPTRNQEDQRDEELLVRVYQIDDLTHQVNQAREQRAKHALPLWSLLGLSGLALIDLVSHLTLFQDMGFSGPTRFMLAAAATASLFYVTKLATDYYLKAVQEDEPPSNWFAVILLLYGLVVFAMSVMRTLVHRSEEQGLLGALATALVLVFSTVGPAWLAERVMRTLARVAPAARIYRNLVRQRRSLVVEVKRGRRNRIKKERILQGWDDDATRGRALYENVYRLTAAKRARVGAEQ